MPRITRHERYYHRGQVWIEPLDSDRPNPYAAGRARIDALDVWRKTRAIPRGFRIVARVPRRPPKAITPADVDWTGTTIGQPVDAAPNAAPVSAPTPPARADAPQTHQGGMFDAEGEG